MKCRTADHWLLVSRCSDEMPKALRRHVADCARCRRRYRKLVRLEEHFKTESSHVDGMAAFLDRIGDLPSREPASAPVETAASRRVFLGWAASILLLIGLIGLFFQLRQSNEDPTPKSARVAPKAQTDDQLVSRFVQRDLALADTTAPSKQWNILSDMADDLRSEVIRLADLKSPDDVPMVVGLYERVLQRGLVGRLKALPENDRRELMQNLAQRLRTQDDDLQARLRLAPADWMTLLQPLQKANRQTADILDDGKAPPAAPVAVPASMPGGTDYRRFLLSALVMNGLRLAEETDPLKRADCCSDLADHLLQAIVTASVKGDQENVSSLGKHLGDFVERGVSANLARVPSNDPRVNELRDIMQRTNQILLALDKTVDHISVSGAPSKADPKSLQQLKELEKMLKDVEKSLKKFNKAFKDADKGEDKKEHKGKGKGKNASLNWWRQDSNVAVFCALSARSESCRHGFEAIM